PHPRHTAVNNALRRVREPRGGPVRLTGGPALENPRAQGNFQGTAWGVGFHPSGFIAGTGGGSGGALWFWRPNQERSFHPVNLPNNARDLHLHPDGRRLAIAFFDGVARIYDMMPA